MATTQNPAPVADLPESPSKPPQIFSPSLSLRAPIVVTTISAIDGRKNVTRTSSSASTTATTMAGEEAEKREQEEEEEEEEEYDPCATTHPFSPFYSHPTTRTSFEQLKSCTSLSGQHQRGSSVYGPGASGNSSDRTFEVDLEAARTCSNVTGGGFANSAVDVSSKRHSSKRCSSVDPSLAAVLLHKETDGSADGVWPCQDDIERRNKQLKRQRVCRPFSKLSARQRCWVKLAIALLIVGIGVGVGLGVSKAVGAGVWRDSNAQTPIGQS